MFAVIQLLIISVSLAMDSLSVSIAQGLKSQKARLAHAVKAAAFFGLFQAGMPFIGWVMGQVLQSFISAVDHWVAFGLLTFIGIKMIRESFKNETDKETKYILHTKRLIALSIATSIDALIVGITLSLLKIPLFISTSVIGVTTFILSLFGFLFGKQLGIFFGKRAEVFGGIALIAIGIKILLEHLAG